MENNNLNELEQLKVQYEALKERIVTKEWKPDFGPNKFTESVAKSGASAIGARDFLIAVNYNLNTTSTRRANAIAFDGREQGRRYRDQDQFRYEDCRAGYPVLPLPERELDRVQ